ncbi:hypothetical protein LPC08_09790 [Roseomonas sp. OT10]|uniref:hypothetical protein n=1 Tax=Roseomonas cutis TaxID=2897332 RepID=UPI001E46ED0B|nr:hypothetical protein [Roseomonas sp. OT10]UFN50872.1 hypothetical protein LPC08_09790 [Roseomonas sp. OT10]
MHTLMVIGGGLALLVAMLLAARLLGGGDPAALALAARIFVPLWLVAAAANLWIGVSRAGYTVMQELPIMLVVFAVPAAVAALAAWRFGRG